MSNVEKNDPDALAIKCIKCDKVVGYELYNKTIEYVIIGFVSNVMFQNFGISWIIKSKEDINFDFDNPCPNWILNGTWNNTTIY